MARKPILKKPKGFDVWNVEDPESAGMTKKDLQKMWQYLVDSGLAWRLQGWYGRTAKALINNGFIEPPVKETKDYYGNTVPAGYK